MRRLLVLTALDFAREPNQRVHHQVRHLAAAFDETVVLYLARGRADRSWGGHWRSLFGLQRRSWREGRVRFVEVDPLWNLPWGSSLRHVRFLSVLLFLPLSLLLGFGFFVGGRFDVVLAGGAYAGAAGVCLKRMGRAGMLVYDDIDYDPGLQGRAFLRRHVARLERGAFRAADLRVSAGEELAALRRAQGVADLHVIPNGVEYAGFAAAQIKPPHPPTLIYTGNLRRDYSGLELALQAWPAVLAALPEARFVIVGRSEPAEEAWLRRRIRAEGLEGRIRLAGECPYAELPAYLGEADLGWALFPPNPTRQLAYPNKVIEYMAAGLGVLTTAGSQAARIVQAPGCGRAVPFEASAAAEALRELLGARQDLAEMGRRGAAAAARSDWTLLMGDYRRLLTAGRGAGEA